MNKLLLCIALGCLAVAGGTRSHSGTGLVTKENFKCAAGFTKDLHPTSAAYQTVAYDVCCVPRRSKGKSKGNSGKNNNANLGSARTDEEIVAGHQAVVGQLNNIFSQFSNGCYPKPSRKYCCVISQINSDRAIDAAHAGNN